MKIEFNKVTWYSKLGAVILFLIVVPVLVFYIGEQYGLMQASYVVVSESSGKVQSMSAVGVEKSIDAETLANAEYNVFTKQPSTIKSIAPQNNGEWLLTLGFLSRNPNFLPGIDDPIHQSFFIDRNIKLENLTVTTATKTYSCGGNPNDNGTSAQALQDTTTYIGKLQAMMSKNESDSQASGKPYDLDAYFDITGQNITAIYDQCLP